MNLQEQAYVELGRKLITLCENNELFNGKDEESLQLWNAAVTAGNKFTSFGTTWSNFKSPSEDSTAFLASIIWGLCSKHNGINSIDTCRSCRWHWDRIITRKWYKEIYVLSKALYELIKEISLIIPIKTS